MDNILLALQQVSPEQWAIAGDMLISAIVAVPALAGLKKWLHVNREFVMLLYVLGGAMTTAAIGYVKQNPEVAPWFFVPAVGSATFVLMEIIYYALWKPGKKRMTAAVAEAKQLNDAKRAAALPADGLPSTNFQ